MAKKLVVVESPTKAKTISKFLGKGFKVLSSFGHIRDLPQKEIGVDIEHDFEPKYVIPAKSKKVVAELKKAAKAADEVYFASDEDREGEAIAWHLSEILKLDPKKTKRISFHEITEEAIAEALKHPRAIDMQQVDAQQARRVLDRLVGYKLSPFLWRKVARGLSAGRVQSVIVRLLVEREREILAFNPQEYWSVDAMLARMKGAKESFPAKLAKKDGATLDKFALGDAKAAEKVVADVKGAAWTIAGIERKSQKRSPLAPFTTSTLQQDANNKLGFSAKQAMMLAQQLYEGVELGSEGQTGLITYMRTDSVTLSEKFLAEAREYLVKEFGADAVTPEARKYKTKAKRAQEAHEAIRPTSAMRHPDDVAAHLDSRQLRLYDLIWRRTMASQMADAEVEMTAITIDTKRDNAPVYTFRASGSTIKKKGFLEVYSTDTKETILPSVVEGEILDALSVDPKQHFTEPPPRYTEATLVKTLEENGIGRPSTYAPTISTVVDRGYALKDGRKLQPTELALLVNDLLVEHFKDIVDLAFTARMEDFLDGIADGTKQWVPVIRDFYGPFAENLAIKDKEISKKDLTETATDEVCPKCGLPMIIKVGRFGKFLACTGYPECKTTKKVNATEEELAADAQASTEVCIECSAPMMLKRSKFGEFLSCSRYPACKTTKTILKKTGVKCNKCKEGDIIEKKTRRGKPFFACSRYPECENALWSKPTGAICPKCQSLVVFAKGDTARCSNKECDYMVDLEETAPAATDLEPAADASDVGSASTEE